MICSRDDLKIRGCSFLAWIALIRWWVAPPALGPGHAGEVMVFLSVQ